jgi:hypothetical protein
MRVHANQVNPYAQLDAMHAAEKAAAKREAAKTRRKLMEFASRLAGESDSGEASIVKLGAREESQEQTKRQNQQKQGSPKKQPEEPDPGDADNSISDWA